MILLKGNSYYMVYSDPIIHENLKYWTNRAPGYSDVNQTELSTDRHHVWQDFLITEIRTHFPNHSPSQIEVLDVGTGPGFFSILLAEAGFPVTAIDLTPAMLNEARSNAGSLANRIRFLEMNAEQLDFADQCFDVVISRNLTWNLPNPEQAYAEWTRVLKPNGLLLNFDANWYHYLFDESARDAYETDRSNTKAAGMKDANIGKDFDVMEEIAARIPLSKIQRPAWDIACLSKYGIRADSEHTVWKQLWSSEEVMNFSSTPLFMVRGCK